MRKYLFILIILFSCNRDEPDLDPNIDAGLSGRVLICNEGNYNWSNASISLYNKENRSIDDSIFYRINGYGLGDVCQSATHYNNKIYVVVNNSAKIEVLNASTFDLEATITGFNSPRYVLPVSADKAYVTDLYANNIWILDLKTNSISGNISCNGWTEELLLRGDNVYVTNMTSSYLYVLDIELDELTDSINIGTGVGSMAMDKDNNIWLLRSETPTLFKLKENHALEQFEITAGDSPSKLKYNQLDHSLWFINGGVDKFDITTSTIEDNYIANSGRNYYGLGIDSENGNVYVSDAKDFVQSSTVYIYSNEAEPIRNFNTGIIAGYFLFGE